MSDFRGGCGGGRARGSATTIASWLISVGTNILFPQQRDRTRHAAEYIIMTFHTQTQTECPKGSY